MKGFVREPPPLDDLVWATAAMDGATSWFHLDTHGFATIVEVVTGSKLWTIAHRHREIPEDDPTGDLSSMHAFGPDWEPTSSGRYRSSADPRPRFEFETIFLAPGMVLYAFSFSIVACS